MNKAEQTRQFIIEKTAPLFNKKGYAATTMSEITSATGLTKGSVYGNFKNKDELAIEVFKYNYRLLTVEIQQEVSSKKTAIDKLLAFTGFYKENYLLIFERGGCAILNTGTDTDDQHKDLLGEVKVALLSWQKAMEKIVEEGINNNEIKPIDPMDFCGFFIALVEGSLFLSKTINSAIPMERNIRRLEQEIISLKR